MTDPRGNDLRRVLTQLSLETMERRLLAAVSVLCLTAGAAYAGVPQDSLRLARDSVETGAGNLAFLSSESTARPGAGSSVVPASAFSWPWLLPEALENLSGGLAPESGRLAGSPLVRGLNAKRTTLTFDGVPLGHSGLREGPSVLPLGAIDPSAIEGILVIRGPHGVGGTVEGMAGSIDIRSSIEGARRGLSASSRPRLTLNQRLTSADRGWSGGMSLEGHRSRVSFRAGAAGRLLGDLRSGTTSGGGASLQPNTSLRESSFHALAAYDRGARWGFRAGVLSSWRRGQGIVDDLERLDLDPLPDEIAVFDPRQFTLAYVSFHARNLGAVRRINSTLWYNGHRQERTFRRPDWDRTVFDNDRLTSLGASVSAEMNEASSHSLYAEAEVRLEGVDARRREIRDDRSVWGQRGRFPSGTRSQLLSVAIHDEWAIMPGFTLMLTSRLSARRIHSAYGPSVFGLTGLVGLVDRWHDGLSWGARLQKVWATGWEVTGSLSSTFRAPGLDDQVANAFWLLGRDVPNPDLRGERATQIEVEGRYKQGTLDVGFAAFRTRFGGLIRRDWFEAGPDGNTGTADDLFRFMNVERAAMVGLEADATVHFDAPWGAGGRATARVALHRWDRTGETMSHYLPPVVGRLASRFTRGTWWVEPYARFSSRTPATVFSRIGAVADATAGWLTWNVRAGTTVRERVILSVALENIEDVRYVEHDSYIWSPGRNVVLTGSYRF